MASAALPGPRPTPRALVRSLSAGSLLFAALLAPAGAQSFNIDFGAVGTPPAGSFAAAAAQPGVWNQIEGGAASEPLVGLGGESTGVTLDSSGVNYAFDNAGTAGDAEALLDSLLDGPSTVVVRGLAPGNYDVFTYAWAPDSATAVTNVEVFGSSDPLKPCGGTWAGTLREGSTHTRHAVTLGGQFPDLMIRFTVGTQFASCNGLQIVRTGFGNVGTKYCTANPNSTGAGASIFGTGSASVGLNHLILTCTNMPQNAAAFFLCSRTRGFFQNPGGSAGNLCLSTPIGRGVGGVIANSGAAGMVSVLADLNMMPQPNGALMVLSGETWNFQCWFRDSVVGGGAISNFSDALEGVFTYAPGLGLGIPIPNMVEVSPGTFLMGSDAPAGLPFGGPVGPVHQVTISYPFWIGRYEVTQAEYQGLMRTNPSHHSGASRPVERVTWHDARNYCAALTTWLAASIPPGYEYRLPTEAEWEYACRAGTTTEFHYGPDLFCDQAEIFWSYHAPIPAFCSLSTRSVGTYAPNGFGLYDMHGNVAEWCLDSHAPYPSAAVTNPFVTGGMYRVNRGGGFDEYSAGCRSAWRTYNEPNAVSRGVGFRVVLAPVLVP